MAKQKAANQEKEKEEAPPPNPISRRLSDPSFQTSTGVEDIGVRSCFKRCTSLSGKMNVTFSDLNRECMGVETNATTSTIGEQSSEDTFVLENSLQDSMMTKKSLFSNSTVSLQSVGLNEEFIKDTQQCGVTSGTHSGENGTVSPTKEDSSKDTKKARPQKPLSEIDRYTMCSNRII